MALLTKGTVVIILRNYLALRAALCLISKALDIKGKNKYLRNKEI